MALKTDVIARTRAFNDAEVLYNRSLNEYKALKKMVNSFVKELKS